MYRFYKHGTEWRFIKKGQEKSEPINTFALESILGVTGTREVIVLCKQPNDEIFHVTVNNGFIIKVEEVNEFTDSVFGEGGDEVFFERIGRYERTEFFAEEC